VRSFGVWGRFHDAGTGLACGRLIRLTNDSGLSDSPALSPDGKLLAYSSDRANEGEMDLHVKQVAGGQPIRLTFDGLGNTNPNFSPDACKIVFESRRDGSGIYEIPVFGGEARLLARGGTGPMYSPDGSQVAYWVGTSGIALSVPGSGTVWAIPPPGGPPRRGAPNLTNARWPVWSPDGKRLLFSGYSSAQPFDPSAMDWWLADACRSLNSVVRKSRSGRSPPRDAAAGHVPDRRSGHLPNYSGSGMDFAPGPSGRPYGGLGPAI
jgi:Tol biopolymer transport system component